MFSINNKALICVNALLLVFSHYFSKNAYWVPLNFIWSHLTSFGRTWTHFVSNLYQTQMVTNDGANWLWPGALYFMGFRWVSLVTIGHNWSQPEWPNCDQVSLGQFTGAFRLAQPWTVDSKLAVVCLVCVHLSNHLAVRTHISVTACRNFWKFQCYKNTQQQIHLMLLWPMFAHYIHVRLVLAAHTGKKG